MGRWPSVREDGLPLDPERQRKGGRSFGHCFALVECRGDWKWHREIWDFRRHYKAVDICHACYATKKQGPYQHLGFSYSRFCYEQYIYILYHNIIIS